MNKTRISALVVAVVVGVCVSLAPSSFAQKKALDHDVYDSWESVQGVQLSDDGTILSYQVSPQQGDGRLVIRKISTGEELVIPRGSGLRMPKDVSYGVFSIKAPYTATRQAKIDKKKKEEMPRDTVVYINLKTLEMTRLEDVSEPRIGHASAPFVFVTKEGKPSKSLIIVNTASSVRDTIKGASAYTLSKEGDKIAYITTKDKKDSLSKSSVVFKNLISGLQKELSEGCKEYSSLTFNDSSDELLFLSTNQEEKTSGTVSCALNLAKEVVKQKATRKTPAIKDIECTELVAEGFTGLPEGYVLSKNSRPRFSNSSKRVILSLSKYYPAKDTTIVDFEAARLDIWNWDALVLPPMAKKGMSRDNRTAMVNVGEPGTVLTLSEDNTDGISFSAGADNDWAISMNQGKYAIESMWSGERKVDVSLVSLLDGSRKSLFKGISGSAMISPYGKYIAWFNLEDGQWYSYDLANGTMVDLTSKTGQIFYDDEDDHPLIGYTPISGPRWMGKDEFVLIGDRYDIWKFSPDGKTAVNLTADAGRRDKIRFNVVDFEDHSEPFLYQNLYTLPLKGRLDLIAFSEEDSRNGYYQARFEKASEPKGFLAGYTYSGVKKVGDELVYLKGNFRNPMDLYTSNYAWEGEQKLSAINPQQSEYRWGDVQLVHWNAYDGTPLKGMLFTPDDMDPQAKYPMMIYFYEKNAETLFNYRAPAPSRSIINIPFFVSRGYVVFVPDVVYTPGHPGESAYNCICAGAEAMCSQFSFIDKSKMAIQGQSWGGYQTAYLVTRTNMFAAAGAGAPVGNMTSAYGGIRWESGSSRIGQYEHGQSRIGKTLWEDGGLDLYIENSPVFHAPNVTTPVLIMHNDADGAVPWYQGIEFFMSLRRLGKPAWLLEYNDEAHNLGERRNAKDLSVRLSQFFDHYLKGEPLPVWMDTGIPAPLKGSYYGFEYVKP